MAHRYVPASWINDPCPRCGNKTLAVLRLVTEDDKLNHSRYVCVLYGKGRRAPCGWEGWTVPGWDEARIEQEAKRAGVGEVVTMRKGLFGEPVAGEDLDGEARLTAALKPFGWEMGPEFWRRYYEDPWVFNLANAVEKLTERLALVDTENVQLRADINGTEWENDLLANAPDAFDDDVAQSEIVTCYVRWLEGIRAAASAILRPARGDAPWMHTAEFDDLRSALWENMKGAEGDG